MARTTDWTLRQALDEVLGNRRTNGLDESVRVTLADLAAQLVAEGGIAVGAAAAAQAVINASIALLEEQVAAAEGHAQDAAEAAASVRDTFGIIVTKSAGVEEGGYPVEYSTDRAHTFDIVKAGVTAGTGTVAFVMTINGDAVFNGTFSDSAPFSDEPLGIASDADSEIVFHITDAPSTVTGLYVKTSGAF